MTTTSPYPPIAEHGLIGDLQSTALVDTEGTIDFFCCPRVDSPTVFGALLDHEQGGQFSVRARADDVVTKQMYLPDTAVLVTRYLAESGVAELADFMPVDQPGVASDRRRLIRVIRGVRGTLSFDVRVAPRFDYGRQQHLTKVDGNHAVFRTDHLVLDLSATVALDDRDGDVWAEVTVAAGEIACFVLESGAEATPTEIGHGEILQLFDDTRAFWHNWVEGGTYRGRWREMVYRSAITLKLLTYSPAGSIVAASTGGLPEQVGGERNWDYRYTWVRDGSFSVRALLALGFRDEAIAFSMWMRDRVEEKREDGSTPLDIMYRVDGSSDLVEETLDHFDGYRSSRPVRIGNGAAQQLQLDIYGEFLDSLLLLDQAGLMIGDAGWSDLAEIIDWLCDNWDQPDEGVWETRGGRQAFVYGRLMCWVAFDRAVRIARNRSYPASLERWTSERDRIYRAIHDKGWNEELQAFVQSEGSDVLDASVLLMPLMGFISPTDPRWVSTLQAMDRTLVSDSLVYRYDPKASPDGLKGSEGTFSICTFWYVSALARSGRIREARLTFEKMLTYSNHLGLFSEEIGATGEQLGNFPQAFTHLSLVLAAIDLDQALDSEPFGR
jgi:GH15 family glucan-1,4-alpha-glucosidase